MRNKQQLQEGGGRKKGRGRRGVTIDIWRGGPLALTLLRRKKKGPTSPMCYLFYSWARKENGKRKKGKNRNHHTIATGAKESSFPFYLRGERRGSYGGAVRKVRLGGKKGESSICLSLTKTYDKKRRISFSVHRGKAACRQKEWRKRRRGAEVRKPPDLLKSLSAGKKKKRRFSRLWLRKGEKRWKKSAFLKQAT